MSQEDVTRNLIQQKLIRERYGSDNKKKFDLFDTFWKIKEYQQTKRIADEMELSRKRQEFNDKLAKEELNRQRWSTPSRSYSSNYSYTPSAYISVKEPKQEVKRKQWINPILKAIWKRITLLNIYLFCVFVVVSWFLLAFISLMMD